MSEEQQDDAKKKGPPEGLVIPPPKPKLSKAERRALQEEQRAAKAGPGAKPPPQQQQQQAELAEETNASESPPKEQEETTTTNNRGYFSHLTPYLDPSKTFQSGPVLLSSVCSSGSSEQLHPAIVQLGHDYATGKIRGGNARCRAMLECYSVVLRDYQPSSAAIDVRQGVDTQVLKPAFTYWTTQCRPHSVSMGNAFSFLKAAVAALDRQVTLPHLQETLLETIDAFIKERIEYADKAIADCCVKLLTKGRQRQDEEVLMVYGYASAILQVLLLLHESKQRKFSVIVVDSRPLMEGRIMLAQLRKAGIPCTYILLNALSYVLPHVTKVLLGASALMSDGSILGRVGSACVALAAQEQMIPVLICSETYKISAKVQLESITQNELGKSDKGDYLLYDLTPSSFVSGIVTELGIVPPSSVAVLLREMNVGTIMNDEMF
jgi:translation initiation factor eIF-2B subunit delta